MKINDSTVIVREIMTNMRTGEKNELEEKLNSKCFFRPVFQHKQYHIQLRLDYTPKGIDKLGNPTLDADIWEEKNGKKMRIMGNWHHTLAQLDPELQRYVYRLRFNGLELDLVTNKTVQVTLPSDTVVIKDHFEVRLNGKLIRQG